jgi:uncharacterized protein
VNPPPQAFFLSGRAPAGGQRLALLHKPVAGGASPQRGAVLFIHAFGEEMNKSRRMVAMTARALAAAGFAVLLIDLLGCGDSSGELGDATWQAWIDDALEGAEWLRRHHPGPLWLWGERSGCLLAAEAAQQMQAQGLGPDPIHFVFWQAQGNGKLVLQQFLRLKMASQIHQGAKKGITEQLQAQLADGQVVEVAGYRLGPGLANGLARASLQNVPATPGGRLVWLEVTSREPAALLPAAEPILAQWQAQGYQISTEAVPGTPFWQTLEIEDAPELVLATVQHLTGQRGAVAAPLPRP